MQNKFEKWKDIARQVLSLAQEVIDNSEKIGIEYDRERLVEEGIYKLIINAFLFNAKDDFRALDLLLTNSLFSQAIMVVRHLFEIMVNLRYISKCPDKRIKQYYRFEQIEKARWLNGLENNELFKINQDIQDYCQELLKESVEDLRISKLPKEWSGCNIYEMSKEIGLSNQYLNVYKICCLFTHPSPWGISHFFKKTPDGSIELNQPHQLSAGISWLATGYFINIIRNADQILGTGLDSSVSEMFAKYESFLKEL